MPFKSEAQKRYLWANEPEIARDWADTYGSRIQKENGGIMGLGPYMGYPSYEAWLAAQRGEGGGGEGPYMDLQQTWTSLPGDPKNYRLSQLEGEADYFPPTTGMGKAKNWFQEKFFQPKVKGTLGDRAFGQYEAGQKLPSFFAGLARAQSTFNPESANYNPNWADQLNYLEMQDKIGIHPTSGLRQYGPESILSGKNVFSGFGSNDYEEQLQKQLEKYRKTWKTKVQKNKWDEARKQKWWEKFIGRGETELAGITSDDQRRADEYRVQQDTPGILYNKGQAKQNVSEDQRRGAFIDTVRQDPGGSGDWKQQTEAKERQGVQVAGPGGGHGAYFKDGGRVPFFYGGLAGIL